MTLRCAYCHEDAPRAELVACPRCASVLHPECARLMREACASRGCEGRPGSTCAGHDRPLGLVARAALGLLGWVLDES